MKLLPFLTWCHRIVLRLKLLKNAWFALWVVKKTSYSCFVSYGGWENAPTKGKTRDRTISDLNIPAGFIVKTWMDDDLMKVWVEDIWIKHIRAECQNLVVPQSANPWMFV